MPDRKVPSDPIAPWFDRAKAAEARVVELEGQLRLVDAMRDRIAHLERVVAVADAMRERIRDDDFAHEVNEESCAVCAYDAARKGEG